VCERRLEVRAFASSRLHPPEAPDDNLPVEATDSLGLRASAGEGDIMASLPITIPAPAEDTLLMSLNTVKLQMVSMKKYLVRLLYVVNKPHNETFTGSGSAHGCAEKRKHDACRTADVVVVTQSIL
jgi:hypothetical protein